MSHRLKIMVSAFILFLDSSCAFTSSSTPAESTSSAGSIENQIASELGLPLDPTLRRVAASDLEKFPLTLDVFRQSDVNPPLGPFRPEYVDALVPASSLPEMARARIAERRFNEISRFEFAVLSQDGVASRVFLASVGVSAPNGNFRLDTLSRITRLEGEDGPSVPVSIPFPWLTTAAIPNEPMTWGLWISGGYFVQSTPYYADLGLSAVNGGVHFALPDAMDLYTLIQATPSIVRIHAGGSLEAVERLKVLATDEWLLPKIEESRMQIAEVVNLLGPDVRSLGHGWVDPLTGEFLAANWPKCGVFDCFKSWHVDRPMGPSSTSDEIAQVKPGKNL